MCFYSLICFLGEAAIYQNGDEKGIISQFDIYGGKSMYYGHLYHHTIKVLTDKLKILQMNKGEFDRLMKPYLKQLETAAERLNCFSHSLS
jgi:hypothetical protein